jgi:aminoglycoside phosphotransferase (APT) family kinase protein
VAAGARAAAPAPDPRRRGQGEPGEGYPYPWSVYRWLDGEIASEPRIADLVSFATALAEFLVALRGVDAAGGPAPGRHNFFRGGPLATYADETLRSIDALGAEIPADAALRVWEDAMAAGWAGDPVWFHGDVATGNLLLRDGRLAAVIDFAPPAWATPPATSSSPGRCCQARAATRSARRSAADPGTWSRGRGWALWKALISLVGNLDEEDAAAAAYNRRTIERVLADHGA